MRREKASRRKNGRSRVRKERKDKKRRSYGDLVVEREREVTWERQLYVYLRTVEYHPLIFEYSVYVHYVLKT
jgi:hypothetical protein